MEKYDHRVDNYISKSADFAKPILTHLRDLVHRASPDITETVKWGMPCYDYKGMICSMASFKSHCSFGFWKASLMPDPHKLLRSNEGMGQFGKIVSLDSLPDDAILIQYIRDAMRLNEEGVKVPKKPAKERTELIIPDYFTEAIKDYPVAKQTFEKFSYSHKKEYLEWVTEAKTELTRQKRLNTTIEWLTEGKSLMWRYEKK